MSFLAYGAIALLEIIPLSTPICKSTEEMNKHTLYVQPSKLSSHYIMHTTYDEYEIYSYVDNNKEYQGTPHVANGILSLNNNLRIQTANLSKVTINILVGQKLATMSRMNYKQINAIKHLKKVNTEQTKERNTEDVEINLSDTDLSNDQKKELQELVKITQMYLPTNYFAIYLSTPSFQHFFIELLGFDAFLSPYHI